MGPQLSATPVWMHFRRWRTGITPLACCELMQHVLLSLLSMMRKRTECAVYTVRDNLIKYQRIVWGKGPGPHGIWHGACCHKLKVAAVGIRRNCGGADGAHPHPALLGRDVRDRRRDVARRVPAAVPQVLHHRRHRAGRRRSRRTAARRHPRLGLLRPGQ